MKAIALLLALVAGAALQSRPAIAQLENRSVQTILNLQDVPHYFQLFHDTLFTTAHTDSLQISRDLGSPNHWHLFLSNDTITGHPATKVSVSLLSALDTPQTYFGQRGAAPSAFFSEALFSSGTFLESKYLNIPAGRWHFQLPPIPGSWLKFSLIPSDTCHVTLTLWMRH